MGIDSRENAVAIARECRQMVLSQGVAGAVANLGVGALFVLALRDVHTQQRLALWGGALLVVSLLRVVVAGMARRASPASSNGVLARPGVCLAIGLLSGAVWGMAATVLFPLGHGELYFVTAFLLIGMPAGALSSFGAWWPAYAAYVSASVGPFAAYFLLSGRAEFALAALAATMFGAFLLREGHVVGRTLQRNVAQRMALMSITRTLGDALDRADAASRAKATFLANMSHELRTPLNAIIGMSRMIGEDPATERSREFAVSIQRAGQALLAMLGDVLDLAQIEAGRVRLQPVALDVRAFVEETLDMFRPGAEAKSLAVGSVYAPEAPARFVADPARLRQILAHLLGNAVKFTERGDIRVEVAAHDGSLRIDVVDTGPGIDALARERIFTAFQQGDGSASRRHPGNGLGLKISHDLAEMMGGAIALVESSPAGCRFRVCLPRIADADHVADESDASISEPLQALDFGSAAHAAEPAGLRVLVVEDNTLNATLLQLLLQRCGCEVVCAASGDEALLRMQSESWGLVLMDCQMPSMDGYEATRRWRELEAALGARPLKIVALTASAMAEDRQRCLQAGMDDFLSKPVSFEALRTMLLRSGANPGAFR